MAAQQYSPKPQARPSKRLRISILAAVGSLLVLAVVLFAYLGSSLFFRQWIQPPLEKALGAPLLIESVDYSPRGHVRLINVEMQPLPGEEKSRLRLSELEIRFRLRPLLSKRVEVSRLLVDSLSTHITKDAGGNLIGPAMGKKDDDEEKESKKKRDKTEKKKSDWKVALSNLEVKNLSALYEDHSRGVGIPDRLEAQDFDLTCPSLILGEKFSAEGEGRFSLSQPGEKQTDCSGRVHLNIVQESLSPGTDSLGGQMEITDLRGKYNGQDLRGFRAFLKPDVKITDGDKLEASSIAMQIESDGKPWARAEISAQWNLKNKAGSVQAKLEPVDRRLLNLLAPPHRKLDFRETLVSANMSASFGPGGVLQEAQGRAAVRNLNPTDIDLPPAGIPSTDANLAFHAGFSEDGATIFLKDLAANLSQRGQGEILTLSLQEPLEINRTAPIPVPRNLGADAVHLTIKNLDLAQWQAILPRSQTQIQSGRISADLRIGKGEGAKDSATVLGSVSTFDLRGKNKGKEFGPFSSQSNLMAVLGEDDSIRIDRLVTSVASNGKSMGTLSFLGTLQQNPLNGRIDAAMQHVRLDARPLPAAFTSRYTLSAGTLSGKASVVLSPRKIQISPDLVLSAMTLQPGKRGAAPIRNLGASIQGQVALSKDESGRFAGLDADGLSVEVRTSESSSFVSFAANGNLDIQQGKGQIKAQVAKADIARILALQSISSEAMQVDQGVLTGDFEITMAGRNEVRALGNAEVRPLAVRIRSGEEMKRLSLPLRLDFAQILNAESGKLQIRKFHAEIQNPSGQPGTLDISGVLSLRPALDGTLTASASQFQVLPLLPFLPEGITSQADLRLARLESLREEITLTGKNREGSAKGSLLLAEVHPPVEKRKTDIALGVGINNNIRFTPNKILLDQVEMDILSPGREPSRIRVGGFIPRGGAEAATGEVNIESDSVDLEPLLLFAGRKPAPNPPPLQARNLKMNVEIRPEETLIKGLQAQMADGEVALQSLSIGRPQENAPAPLQWNQFKATGLDVPTFLSYFAPKQAGRVTGKFEMESSGTAQGFTEEAMQKALRSTANVRIKDGQLRSIPLLEELASITQMRELRDFAFFRVESNLRTEQDGVQVQDIYIVGPAQKLRLRGRVQYDQNMLVNLELGLAGALQEKIRKTSYGRFLKADPDGYLVFPTPLAVSGYLGKPKIKLTLPTQSLIEAGRGALQQELQRRLGGDARDPEKSQSSDQEEEETGAETLRKPEDSKAPGSLLDIGAGLLRQRMDKRREGDRPEKASPTPPTQATPIPAPTPAAKPKSTPRPSLLDIGTDILQQRLDDRRKRE